MRTRKKIDGGFLMLPNVLVDRILKSDLSVEIKVLLLCLRWTLGYGKEICTPSLTALQKETGHNRKFLSKVLQGLVSKRFLQQVAPATRREPAKYRVLLRWDSPTTVGHLKPLASPLEAPSESHYSRTECPTTVGQGCPTTDTRRVPLQGDTTYIAFIDSGSIERKIHKPSLKGSQGTSVGSAEKRATDANAFSNSLTEQSSLPGDFVPLPADGTPLKADPKPLIREFEQETGMTVNPTKTEMREFYQLMEECHHGRYVSEFVKLVLKIKHEPAPDYMKRPEDVMMLLARGAAIQAKQSGARL